MNQARQIRERNMNSWKDFLWPLIVTNRNDGIERMKPCSYGSYYPFCIYYNNRRLQ